MMFGDMFSIGRAVARAFLGSKLDPRADGLEFSYYLPVFSKGALRSTVP